MRSRNISMASARAAEEDDLFEMANLFPGTTGLPMTVWVGPRGNGRHDARTKANMAYGNQMSPSNTAVVAVRPSPHVVAGSLAPDDQRAVFNWITLNGTAMIAYWQGDIDTVQLAQLLRPLSSPP
jgi:hypothetical protein